MDDMTKAIKDKILSLLKKEADFSQQIRNLASALLDIANAKAQMEDK